jgi:superfamily II DNA or RNA helicase
MRMDMKELQRRMSSLQLRDWQQEAVNEWLKRDKNSAGIWDGTIAAVTGSGKTRAAIALVYQWLAYRKDQMWRVVICVPTKRLLNQWYDEMRAWGFTDVARYGGGYHNRTARVLVTTANSARKLRNSTAGTFLIVDECHRFATNSNKSVFTNIRHEAVLGLSATPSRIDGKNILNHTGAIVYRMTYAQALEQRCIPLFRVRTVGIKMSFMESNGYDDYTESIRKMGFMLKNDYGDIDVFTTPDSLDERIPLFKHLCIQRKRVCNSAAQRFDVCKWLVEKHYGEKISIFHESVQEIEKLSKELWDDGLDVYTYHSNMDPKRQRGEFKRWCESDRGILLSCKALKEGVNVPDMGVAIMLSGTNDARSRIQTLGRALRGDDATIYIVYIPYTTDQRGWQNMLDVGGIPNTITKDGKTVDIVEYFTWDAPNQDLIMTTKPYSMVLSKTKFLCKKCMKSYRTEHKWMENCGGGKCPPSLWTMAMESASNISNITPDTEVREDEPNNMYLITPEEEMLDIYREWEL